MSGQNCGNCKWLKIDREESMTKHEIPRWKKDAGGQCVWVMPELVLPKSITSSYGFRPFGNSRSFMQATQTDCPTWEALDPNQN